MKGKLKFIEPHMLMILLGGVYKTVIDKQPTAPNAKIAGTVYVLPKEFLLNMADNRYAKLDVALVLSKSEALPATEAAPSSDATYGPLEQEPAVRDVITNVLTDAPSKDLIDRAGREHLKALVLKGILQNTDVKVDKVLFTDVAVQ